MGFTSVESITYAVFRIYRLLDEELINNSGSPISTRRRSDRLCSTQIISGLVNGQNFRYRSRIFLKNFTGQHSEGLRWRFGVPFIRLVCAVRTSSKHTATVSSNPSFCDTWNLSSAECGRFFLWVWFQQDCAIGHTSFTRYCARMFAGRIVSLHGAIARPRPNLTRFEPVLIFPSGQSQKPNAPTPKFRKPRRKFHQPGKSVPSRQKWPVGS